MSETPIVTVASSTAVTPGVPLPFSTFEDELRFVTPLLKRLGRDRDEHAEDRGTERVNEDARALRLRISASQAKIAGRFLAYGISSETVALGERERRAMIRDYLETERRPNVVWKDVVRLAKGQAPETRNFAQERRNTPRLRRVYSRIYGHTPRLQDVQERLAWFAILYRVRFDRNTELETNALTEFQRLFHVSPKTPSDWAVLRVIAYVRKSL